MLVRLGLAPGLSTSQGAGGAFGSAAAQHWWAVARDTPPSSTT
ncbi:hypothetical protein [Friedmanniella luteola]|nr:hypothetical protein [Friedmanniella luteola]